MGILDRLGSVLEGARDAITAPIGLVYDVTRSFVDEDLTLGDAFGRNAEQFFGGFGQVGRATGFTGLYEATPLDDAINAFFREMELYYSTSYQEETDRVPGLYRLFGQTEPGQFALDHPLATATHMVGALAPGGARPTLNFLDAWRATEDKGPGTAMADAVMINPNMTQREMAEVRNSTGYTLLSGTIDAFSRWRVQPEIILGKGVKSARRRLFPTVEDIVARHHRRNPRATIEQTGGPVHTVTDTGGMPYYVVMRRSALNGLRRRGLQIAETADPVVTRRHKNVDRVMDDIGAERRAATADEIAAGAEESLGILDDYEVSPGQIEGAVSRANDAVAGSQNPTLIRYWEDMMDGRVGDKKVRQVMDFLKGHLDDVDRAIVSRVLREGAKEMGDYAFHNPRASQRLIREPHDNATLVFGPEDRPMMADYADDLVRSNPNDPVVILEVDATGMHFMVDDIYGIGEDAMVTFLDELTGERVQRVHRVTDKSPIAEPMRETRQKPAHLYNADGTVLEPDGAVRGSTLTERAHTIINALEGGNVGEAIRVEEALARAASDNPYAGSAAEALLTNRRVQRTINKMLEIGDPSEIRRRYFPGHTHGMVLSRMIADATSYEEVFAILASAAGLDVPQAAYLRPQVKVRIDKLRHEVRRQMPEFAEADRLNREVSKLMLNPDYHMDANDMAKLSDLAGEEVRALMQEHEYGLRLRDLQNASPITTLPHNSYWQALHAAVRDSYIYQQSALGAPLRVMGRFRAHRHIDLADPRSDRQIVRFLEELQPAGVTPEMVTKYHNEFLRARSPGVRAQVVARMQEDVIRVAAKALNMSPGEVNTLLQKVFRSQRVANDWLSSRAYGPEESRIFIDPDTGERVYVNMPLVGTQVARWQTLPDPRRLVKIVKMWSQTTARLGRGTMELNQSLLNLWKPTVLLRSGWPIRVVGDEQMRILAKVGSLSLHLAAVEAGELPKWGDPFRPLIAKEVPIGKRLAAAAGLPVNLGVTTLSHTMAGLSKIYRALGRVDDETFKLMQEAGTEPLASARASFTGPTEAAAQYMASVLGYYEAGLLDEFRSRATGQWMSVGTDSPHYKAAWARALNEQLGRDDWVRIGLEVISQELAAGTRLEDAVALARQSMMDWLEHSAAGHDYQTRMPWMTDHAQWTDNVLIMMDQYTGHFNPNLVKDTLARRIRRESMERLPIENRPRTVHAEIIDQTLGQGGIVGVLRDMTSGLFDTLGRLPTDTLSRQPFFRLMFAEDMKRKMRVAEAEGVEMTIEKYEAMAADSRGFALTQVKTYLYDLAETSQFGHMTRFLMPFFPAWQEVMGVWARIAIEDPSVIGKARLLWEAPNKAGLVERDEEGNEFIRIQLSERFWKILGKDELTAKYLAEGGLRFNKRSFNLALNSNLPNAGPWVQYPINEMVKHKPELEEAFRWALPYGVEPNGLDIWLSPLVKRARSYWNGHKSDQQYQRQFVNALTWLDHLYRTGERSIPPSIEDAKQIADSIFFLQTMSNFLMPAQPIVDSPLRPYMEIWTDLVEAYGQDIAEEKFLNQYGPEFFGVTLGRTRSVTGIPPTVEAQVARRELESLIDRYPEYGRLIVGEDASVGEFSDAAFAWQLAHKVDVENPETVEGDSERIYRIITLDPDTGTIEELDSRLGWIEYINFLDRLETTRIQQGLPNLRVAEARPLAAMKSAFIARLSRQYPAWERSFNLRNDLKWRDRIRAFSALAESPLLQDRPDWEGIRLYLAARQSFINLLNSRKQLGGSASLSAVSNQDIALSWQSVLDHILTDNVQFGPIYYRYLEGDPLEAGT